MISLAAPWFLLLLPLPWLFRRLFPPRTYASNTQALRTPFLMRFKPLVEQKQTIGSSRLKSLLLCLFWLSLLLSAARPTWFGQPVSLDRTGRDLLLAVDVSESMQRADFVVGARRVDRLTAVKVVLANFIQKRPQDRLGLILFGSQAYLQTPLTLDHRTLKKLLDESAIGIAGPKTAIGDAIGLAIKRLEKQSAKHRVLILLTDGSNTAGELKPIQAAALAKEAGVKIYTISLGSGYRTSESDQVLMQVAQTTGGQAFQAQDTQTLETIYSLLDELETSTIDQNTVRPQRSLFHWPLGLGIICFWLAVTPLGLPSLNLSNYLKLNRGQED